MNVSRQLGKRVDRQLRTAKPDVREGVSRGSHDESSATRSALPNSGDLAPGLHGGVIDGLAAARERGIDHLDRLDDVCAELG